MCNLEREYRDCIKMLYVVQLPNEEGDMHIVYLVHHDMPCDPNLVSSAFIQSLSKYLYMYKYVVMTCIICMTDMHQK